MGILKTAVENDPLLGSVSALSPMINEKLTEHLTFLVLFQGVPRSLLVTREWGGRLFHPEGTRSLGGEVCVTRCVVLVTQDKVS